MNQPPRTPAEPLEAPLPRILIIDDQQSIHADYRKVLGGSPERGKDLAGLRSLEDAIFGESAGDTDDPEVKAAPAAALYAVDSAYQGRDGLAKVVEAARQNRPYRVAFVDMRMPPGWDGIDTIERLWKADPDLHVILCTAFSDEAWDKIILRLNRPDQLLLLRKPFDPAEVSQMAAAFCSKWKSSHDAALHFTELQAANRKLHDQITQRETTEERLRRDALHDTLTGLPNRAMLSQRLDRLIRRSQVERDVHFATLFIDLDDFKLVNDSFGHHAGDELLLHVAQRLSSSIRGCDTVSHESEKVTARLGGDEFVVLLENVADPRHALSIAERLQEDLRQPMTIAGRKVAVGCSVGIAMSGGAALGSAVDVLREADTAMYRAKLSGKGRAAIFDDAMHKAVIDRVELENDLRYAVDRRQLHLMYQPILHLDSGRLHGFEALARWVHPKRGPIAPDVFIPIAEEIGLISDLGLWILREACVQARRWNDQVESAAPVRVSVNVSKIQLLDPRFIASLRQVLVGSNTDARHLALELTESTIMSDPQRVGDALRAIRDLGMAVHMEDFGTGHSSLSCLHRFPIDVLKIDRSFMSNLTDNRDYAAIIQAITHLAHNLGARVIAEGIETPEQHAQLIALECDYGQGYLFSRPIDADSAALLLHHGSMRLRTAG